MAKGTRPQISGSIAFVFPGQGSQYVGMGRDLYRKYSEVREVFEKSNQVTGKDISSLCFEGPQDALNRTVNTQIAVFTFDCACYFLLRGKVNPAIVAGHSLGEYSALVAAEVISLEEGLELVKKRAELMERQAQSMPGKMIAVLGLDEDEVVERVDLLRENGIVNVANYNCPGQIVVSGEASLINQAIKIFTNMGARRVVELRVSGAFHSPLMRKAEEEFTCFLKEVPFKNASVPVISNYTGRLSIEGEELKKALAKQITGSVKWRQSIQLMIKEGITEFIELGPGRVLSGLTGRINSTAQVLNVEDETSLSKTLVKVA